MDSGDAQAVSADRASYRTIGPEAEGQRLDNYLIRIAKGVPKSHVYRIVRQGEVRVNKGRVAIDYRLAAGDQVRIPPMRLAERAPTPVAAVPAAMPPILFEDEHLMAVDKPAGLAAHGGSGIAFGLIERVRAARPNQPFLELVHRLDRETSGILLLAKSRRALLELHGDLREGRVEKRYSVLVKGDWVNDRQHVRLALTKYINRHGERRVSVDTEGMESHTVFSLLKRYRAVLAARGRPQDRPHASDPRTPVAPRISDRRRRQVWRLRIEQTHRARWPLVQSAAPDADVPARGRGGLQASGHEPPDDARSAFAERMR